MKLYGQIWDEYLRFDDKILTLRDKDMTFIFVIHVTMMMFPFECLVMGK